MRLSTHSSALLIAIAAGVPAAADDLTIVSKVTSDKNPPVVSTSYMASDHIRMAHGDGHEVLMDLKTGDFTTLDNKKKEYYVVTKQDMQAMAAKMQEQMNSPEVKKAQEQMKNLPPEMQKKMESMMGGAMGTVDVRKLGTSRKIAGYGCDEWSVTIGEMSKTQQCLTTELQFPVQAFEAYKEFAESMKAMMQSMGPMAKGMGQMQEKMKEMKGFPLASTNSVSIMGRSSSTSTEVTEIKRGPIPPSAWVVPADYKKVDNPMTKAFQRKSK